MRIAALALAALLGACASAPRIGELLPGTAGRELDRTPFFPQADYQCGPAALATALGASGVAVTPDELVPKVYLPERRGSLQPELVATARAYGRVPYVLEPSLKSLLAEVAAGRPVLVLQNLGFAAAPAWHYAVVVGFDALENHLVLRSGGERRKLMSVGRFLRSWELAERWALVLAPPETPPATAKLPSWLQAASAFEELDRPDLAESAYAAATRRWPDQPLGWQLLGNARYGQRDLTGARAAFREALAREPTAATHNNLAQVLMELGCPDQAQAEIEKALAGAAPEPVRAAALRTRDEISRYAGARSASCGD